MSTKRTARPAAPQAAGKDELLDLDQAIARLATTRPTFYRWLRSGRIKGLKAGRQWRFRREDIEALLQGTVPSEALTADIRPLISALEDRLRAAGVEPKPVAGDDGVVEAVRLMIRLGAALNASNLHLEMQHDEREPQLRLRYRIDGELHEGVRADHRLAAPLVQQWKRMACCDLNERRLPQDGRILATIDGASCDLRVSFLPSNWGESLTVRFLRREAVALSIERIPFTPCNQARLETALTRRFGLIITTGPGGSGRTTTTYACLARLARPTAKVLSIENPVEFRLPGVTQVGLHAGLTWVAAMRAVLRSDPDVVHVGALTDRDTMQACVQAALAGQVVLTQMHSPDAAGALRRLIENGMDPSELAEATTLVIGQRLVRRLCPHCSLPLRLDGAREEQMLAIAREGGLAVAELPREFRKAVGCAKCGQTGYSGRTVINEMLAMDDAVAAALRRGAPAAELRRAAIDGGMVPLAADGLWRAARGETSIEEVLRNLPRP